MAKQNVCPQCRSPELLSHSKHVRHEIGPGVLVKPEAPAAHHYRAFKCGRYETRQGNDNNWATHLECKPMKCMQCGELAAARLDEHSIIYICAKKHPAVMVGKFTLPV